MEDTVLDPHFCYFGVLEAKDGLLLSYYCSYVHATHLFGGRVKKIPYEWLGIAR